VRDIVLLRDLGGEVGALDLGGIFVDVVEVGNELNV
jgi:hypothetical protein